MEIEMVTPQMADGEDPRQLPPTQKPRKQYRGVCLGCKQASVWGGRKWADKWSSGHEKLCGNPCKVEVKR